MTCLVHRWGELQQDSQVLNQDLQSRREALVRELQEVDEQLFARKGRLPEGRSSALTRL